MDYQDEEEAIAEAIRLSLLEARSSGGSNNTFQAVDREENRSSTGQRPRQQPPPPPLQVPHIPRQSTVIDLTDDFESDSDIDAQDWPAFLPLERPTFQRSPVPQAPPPYHAPQPLMEDNDEEEDEDFKRALALSLEDAAKEFPPTPPTAQPHSEPVEKDLSSASQSSSLTALLGASRAELERERQERLQKRTAPSTSPPTPSAATLPTSSATRKNEELADGTEHRRKIPKTVLYSKDTSPIPTSTLAAPSVLPLPSSIGFVSKSSTPPLQGGSTLSSSKAPKVTGKFAKLAETATLRKESSPPPRRSISSSSLSSPLSPQAQPRRPPSAADQSPPSSRNPSSGSLFSIPASSFVPSTPALSYASSISSSPASRASSSASSSSSAAYPPRYRRATFFNTYIKGKRQDQHTIQFGDLVDKNHVQKAIVTTFQLDPEWLDKYLPTTISQCRFVHWYKDKGEQPGFHRVSQQVVEVHPPMTGGMGIFHPKLMLLFYPGFCRVVVSTANLVDYDWDELVNSVYVQDFVMRPSGPVEDPEDLGEFGCSLHNYLKVMTAPDKVLRVICAINFSTAKVLLVPSVQGSFPIDSRHTYGLAQLGKIMETRTVPTQSWDMEYTTSSLGKLNVAFLKDIDRASKGLPPRVRSRVDVEERMPSIKVIFPTERNVLASRNGEMGAGTVCFQQQYWRDPMYPRSVMHDFECVGEMKGSLMHTKMILARAAKPAGGSGYRLSSSSSSAPSSGTSEKSIVGWIYLGSANFTESAWGKAIKKTPPPPKKPAGRPAAFDPAANKPLSKSEVHISMRNWELGILYPIETEEELESYFGPQSKGPLSSSSSSSSSSSQYGGRSEQTFFGPMPVPYERPVRPYVTEDSPWFR